MVALSSVVVATLLATHASPLAHETSTPASQCSLYTDHACYPSGGLPLPPVRPPIQARLAQPPPAPTQAGFVFPVDDSGKPGLATRRDSSQTPFGPKDRRSLPMLIDDFKNPDVNALGMYHIHTVGTFQEANGRPYLNLSTNSTEDFFSTSLSQGCYDLKPLEKDYLHISYSGSRKFSVSLQQLNDACKMENYPRFKTWDSIEAAHYSWNSNTPTHEHDLYVPISHFSIDLKHAQAFRLHGFYMDVPTLVYQMEIVTERSLPGKVRGQGQGKLAAGKVFEACTQSGLIALGIDDGNPRLAEKAMEVIKVADVPVTFFVQGQALDDKNAPFSRIYKEMDSIGHQIALHSYDHPPMESLREDSDIDSQFRRSIDALKNNLNLTSSYFRPPFGVLGARTRQRLAMQVTDPKIVMWSIDVEDWQWGNSSTPEKQLQTFETQLNAGGDIVVMHYLFESTISQMKAMIDMAKAKGRKFVRMDQCLGERDANKDWKKAAGDVKTDAQKSVASSLSNPMQTLVRLVKAVVY